MLKDIPDAAQMSRQCFCLNAQRAARAVARRYDAAFRSIGITSGQFSLLAALNQPDAPTLGELAAILGVERTTLTRNARPLVAAGLIRLDPGERDQRRRRLVLTAAGGEKLREAMPLWCAAQEASEALLAPREWQAFQPGLLALAHG